MKIMKKLVKRTETYRIDSEKEAAATVEEYKQKQYNEGFTVAKTKVDYKNKKDRKTGEIIDEWWNVEITVTYEL